MKEQNDEFDRRIKRAVESLSIAVAELFKQTYSGNRGAYARVLKAKGQLTF